MSDRKYGLYKRIMKRDPKAIDEIETLEEAKEIINMMIGNVYLSGKLIYQTAQEFMQNNLGTMNFATCQHRKEMEVMGVKQRSLFCDFDDMECDESNGKCRNQSRF